MTSSRALRQNTDAPRIRTTARWTTSILAFAVVHCTPPSHLETAPAPPLNGRLSASEARALSTDNARLDHLVIIALDGVRWQDLFTDADSRLMNRPTVTAEPSLPRTIAPEIHRIANTHGKLLGNRTEPVFVRNKSTLSLPGYAELFTGRTPICATNDCGPIDEPTLLDDWYLADASVTQAVISSWAPIPNVAARDPSHLTIYSGRSRQQQPGTIGDDLELTRLLASGASSSPAPGTGDYRPDRYTADIGLWVLRSQHPNFRFLGLGDTDEYAHQGNYSAYLTALNAADTVVGHIDTWLRTQQKLGKRTLLIVTTDHGRANNFRDHGGAQEASRTWMLWSSNLRFEAVRQPQIPFLLVDIVPTVRAILGLAPDLDLRAGQNQSAWFDRAMMSPNALDLSTVASR